MSDVLAIIQARMGSSRLPGKMMARLIGAITPLEMLYRRLRRSCCVTSFIVATTVLPEDDELAAICADLGIPCHRGSPDDVLDRYHSACLTHGPVKAVIRITGDCPFHDPEVVDRVAKRFLLGDVDYAANTLEPTFPDGLDVEAFSPEVLETMWREACLPSEREHVTQFVHGHLGRFQTANVRNDVDLSSKRWTLDEPADLEFIRSVLAEMEGIDWGWRELLQLLERKPELERINGAIARNQGLIKSKAEEGGFSAPTNAQRRQDPYKRSNGKDTHC